MTMQKYLVFDLLIEQVPDGYTVRVLDSPGGQAKAHFTLPFEDHELKKFFVQIGHPRSIEHKEVYFREKSEISMVKEFGSRLYKAIFKDEVRDCLNTSLHLTSRQDDVGLRIRLRLDDAPELADVPWEYLYVPRLNRFLGLSVDTPIVRYLALPEGDKPLHTELPLNILVMISSPNDYPSLDVNREWINLKNALDNLEQKGLVKLELLKSATLSALHQQLNKDKYHIFHYIGHGGFDEQAQDGILLFEDERGNGRKVSGQKLGRILHDEQTLRLVVLNACEGARTSRMDPFAGTAQSLIQQGIPAVIAMQFEITDMAAITLSHIFYKYVAEGYPVDYSLAEARKEIDIKQDSDSVEWGTPVLYLRSGDGRLFKPPPRRSRIWYWIGGSAFTAAILYLLWPIIFPSTVDLSIQEFFIEPDTLQPNDTVRAEATIMNMGDRDAQDVVVRWWPSEQDSEVFLEDTIPLIHEDSFEEVLINSTWSISDPGQLSSMMAVYLSEQGIESIEDDTVTQVWVEPRTELSVTIDSYQMFLEQGDTLKLLTIIYNSGAQNAESVAVSIDDIDGSTLKDTTLAAVPADSSVQLPWVVNTNDIDIGFHELRLHVRDRAGREVTDPFPIRIYIAPDSVLPDHDQVVNPDSIPEPPPDPGSVVDIDTIPEAELSVKSVEVTYYDGESVTVMITIENTGGADANSVEVLFAPGPVGRLQPRTISVDSRDSTSVEFAASFERTNESVKARIIVYYHGVQVDRCEHTWNP